MRDAAQRRAASGLASSKFVQRSLARFAEQAGVTKQRQTAPARHPSSGFAMGGVRFIEAGTLDSAIAANLKELGYGG